MIKSFLVGKYSPTYGDSKSGMSSTNNPAALADGALGVYAVHGSADKPVLLASNASPTFGLNYFTNNTATAGSVQNVKSLLICQGTATDDYISVEIKGDEITSWKGLAYSAGTGKVVYAGNQGSGSLDIDTTGASTDEYLFKVVNTTKNQEPLARFSASVVKGSLNKTQVVVAVAGSAMSNPSNTFVKVQAVGTGQTAASTNTGTYTTATVTYGSKTILLNGTNVEIVTGDYMEISSVLYIVANITTTTNSNDTITLTTPFTGSSSSSLAKASIKRVTALPTYVGLKVTGIDPATSPATGTASALTNFEVAVGGAFAISSTGTPVNTTTALVAAKNLTSNIATMEKQAREYQGFEARHLVERFDQPSWYIDSAYTYSLLTIGYKHKWNSVTPAENHTVDDEVVIASEISSSTDSPQAVSLQSIINYYVRSIPNTLPTISTIS